MCTGTAEMQKSSLQAAGTAEVTAWLCTITSLPVTSSTLGDLADISSNTHHLSEHFVRQCSPAHDKLSLSCLSESYVFAGCPFSSKIFPVPFFNRGKTGKLGRTEVEQSEHSQKIIGGVVYAELIV